MPWLACALCLSGGLLAGYAAGVAQMHRYFRQIFEDMMQRFEERAMCHLIEKSEWIESLRRSARTPEDDRS